VLGGGSSSSSGHSRGRMSTGEVVVKQVARSVASQVGTQIGRGRAREVFNHVFEQAGIDAVLVPACVAEYDICSYVAAAFAATNFGGMLVTIPHKTTVLPYLARCDQLSQVAGAVNGIRRGADGQLEGGFFDGLGLVGGLDSYRFP